MQLFVDGALNATAAYSGTPGPSTANGGNIRLGNHYLFSRPLNGLLDDVRIYNHALSQTGVSRLAAGVPEPGSMILWPVAMLAIAARRRRT